MDIDYWSRFLRTGSVEDYLQYRQCLSMGAQHIIKEVTDGKSTTDSKRCGAQGTSDEGER